ESKPPPHFHFGIEVTCMRQWELDEISTGRHKSPTYGLEDCGPGEGPLGIDLTRSDIEAYGIEYVVGGTHWARGIALERKAIIDNFQRQNMYLATHPLIDIVAHPWWWHGHFQDERGRFNDLPWFDDFKVVPQSFHDEFAAALTENKKATEINPATVLNGHYPPRWREQYLEYLAELVQRGVKFSIGSDCHRRPYANRLAEVEPLLDRIGLREGQVWHLPPRSPKQQRKVTETESSNET
ncbi:MAG: hypothetical protein ACYTF6_13030, partial [Planctomycetota bacterium]